MDEESVSMRNQFVALQRIIICLVLVGLLSLPGTGYAQEGQDQGDNPVPTAQSSVYLQIIQNSTGEASTTSPQPGPAQPSCPPRFLSEQEPTMSEDCAPSVVASVVTTPVLPSNFQETIVFRQLLRPTAVRFANDGRVFIGLKDGRIFVFPSLTAVNATTFADLRTQVDDYMGFGLLGLEFDPNFPTKPYVYALYTYDAPIGGTARTWNDACPTPPGPTTDGCVVSGRLVRLTAAATGNTMVPGSEQVLINDWCQQFPSHSIGQLAFGPDGALYVSGGEGGSYTVVDYGQYGGTYSDPRAPHVIHAAIRPAASAAR